MNISIGGFGATESNNRIDLEVHGITLRDLFAMASIAGIREDGRHPGATIFRAREAYAMADAMLAAREAKVSP